jgi:hypothetical protein
VSEFWSSLRSRIAVSRLTSLGMDPKREFRDTLKDVSVLSVVTVPISVIGRVPSMIRIVKMSREYKMNDKSNEVRTTPLKYLQDVVTSSTWKKTVF